MPSEPVDGSTRPPRGRVAAGPDADPESVARRILLDQLTGRARSRQELSDKLASRHVPDDVATDLLDRFEEVGLVDDGAFARTWVSQRQQGKGLSRRVLAQELRRKGVDDEVAREALDEIDPAAEAQAAHDLVRQAGCGRCDASTTRSRPGGWSGCWPARATRRGSRSRRPRGAPASRTRRGRRRGRLTHHDGGMTLAALRLPPGPVDLASLDSAATPGFTGDKKEGQAELESLGDDLADLQERLYAEATSDLGHGRAVLLVLQGMDTSGKGGVAAAHRRAGRPAGCRDHLLQGADRGGAEARLPLADPQGAADQGSARRLRPEPLRGRADRAGAPAGPGGGDREALRRDQRVRGGGRGRRASR